MESTSLRSLWRHIIPHHEWWFVSQHLPSHYIALQCLHFIASLIIPYRNRLPNTLGDISLTSHLHFATMASSATQPIFCGISDNFVRGLYITLTSQWVRWRLKSPASPLFSQPFIQAQIKEYIKAPRHWPLCGEFTGDRWIPRTNGQ